MVWLPWSGMIFAVVSESIRPTGRESLIFTTLSWAGFCTIVVPTVAVFIDILCEDFAHEDYRAGTIGARRRGRYVRVDRRIDLQFEIVTTGSIRSSKDSFLFASILIWIAPLGASFALRCLTIRRGRPGGAKPITGADGFRQFV